MTRPAVLVIFFLALTLVAYSSADEIKYSNDEDKIERLNSLVNKIRPYLPATEKPLDVRLVLGNNVNAWVDKDGAVNVSEGVLSIPEQQAYFLLCHEITHFVKKHHKKQKKRNFLTGLGVIGLHLLVRGKDKKIFTDLGESLHNFSSCQFAQAQEQEADREAAALLAKMNIDPINSVIYFKTFSPASESKDILGTHPTFAARIQDLSKVLPSIDYSPRIETSSKSLLAFKPVYADQNQYFQGQLNPILTADICSFTESALVGLPFDQYAAQILRSQVATNLTDQDCNDYLISVKRYPPGTSTTVIETDTLATLVKSAGNGAAFRSYCAAVGQDSQGQKQVALLLLKR